MVLKVLLCKVNYFNLLIYLLFPLSASALILLVSVPLINKIEIQQDKGGNNDDNIENHHYTHVMQTEMLPDVMSVKRQARMAQMVREYPILWLIHIFTCTLQYSTSLRAARKQKSLIIIGELWL